MTFVRGWGFHCLAKGGYDLGQLCWPANFQNSQVCWSKAVLEDNSLSCFQRWATSHDGKDDVRDEEEDEAKEEKDSLSFMQLFPIYSGFSWPLSYSVFCNQHFQHVLLCPSHGWDSSTREAKKSWRISLEAEESQNTYLTQSLNKYLLASKVSALEKQQWTWEIKISTLLKSSHLISNLEQPKESCRACND